MRDKYFKWGIIGTGGIANAFYEDIKYLENLRYHHVITTLPWPVFPSPEPAIFI